MAQICIPDALTTELIVVDNDSTDETAEVVKQCSLPNMPVRYLKESRRGLSYARNAGMATAEGQVFLFTDDDVRPPRNWIEGMCRPILTGEMEAVAGGVRFAPHLNREWMQPRHRALLASTERIDPLYPEDMVGANMAFSKEVLKKVPQFDIDLGAGALGFVDDSLFSLQLLKAGYHIGSALNTEVEHHFQEDRLLRAGFLQTAMKFGQSAAYTSYHWHHLDTSNLHIRLAIQWTRLIVWRASHWKAVREREGIAVRELDLLSSIHSYLYLMRERGTPRHYEKHGLLKLRK